MKINQEKKSVVLEGIIDQLKAGETLPDDYIVKENRLAAEKWFSRSIVLLESFLPHGSVLYKQLENCTSGALQGRVGQMIGILASCRSEVESGRADVWFVEMTQGERAQLWWQQL